MTDSIRVEITSAGWWSRWSCCRRSLILLRRVLKPPLIATFVAVAGAGIIAVGYLFNAVIPV